MRPALSQERVQQNAAGQAELERQDAMARRLMACSGSTQQGVLTTVLDGFKTPHR
jgi:hypothetical protein